MFVRLKALANKSAYSPWTQVSPLTCRFIKKKPWECWDERQQCGVFSISIWDLKGILGLFLRFQRNLQASLVELWYIKKKIQKRPVLPLILMAQRMLLFIFTTRISTKHMTQATIESFSTLQPLIMIIP